jgi:hypothetical protein
MQDQDFSAAQSLRIIEDMINQARNRFGEDGVLYLLWGWAVFCFSLIHFVLLHWTIVPHPEMIWSGCGIVALIQAFYLVRKKKKARVTTFMEKVNGYVWIAFFFMLMLMGYLIGKNNLWDKMYPTIFVLYGMPTFLSGLLLRFPPLRWGGVFCWMLAIVASFMRSDYQLLLLALAVVAAWIIPGYLLQKKYKQESR